MLAMGDALAMTVAHRKSFKREEYALYHPGGALGRQLVTVGEVMRTAAEATIVGPATRVRDALSEMTRPRPGRARSGAILVTDGAGMLLGIFTDGDLRRRVVADADVLERPIEGAMTRNPKFARKDELLADAYKRLKEFEIDELPVVDEAGRAAGISTCRTCSSGASRSDDGRSRDPPGHGVRAAVRRRDRPPRVGRRRTAPREAGRRRRDRPRGIGAARSATRGSRAT